MFALFITIFFSLGFAYFATQNTLGVPIKIAYFTFTNIPLYIVILGSLLVGILLATIINIVSSFTSYLILRKRENLIKDLKKTVVELIKRVHILELEIEKSKDNILEKINTKEPIHI